MNEVKILDSIFLKKRFCTDCGIPMSVYDNPYFYQRICTLEPFYGSKTKFKRFCDSMERYATEQEYSEDYNRIKEEMIQAIKSDLAYDKFVEIAPTIRTNYTKKELYSPDNATGWYISIDMSAANFNAVRFFDPNIFGGAKTWQDFVKRFTDNEHIIESKYIRQVVMGACNPRAQTKFETAMMSTLLDHIIKEIPSVSVFSLGTDEIILEIPETGCGYSLNALERVVKDEPNGIGELVKIQSFCLRRIGGTEGYTKTTYDGEVSFKCLSAKMVVQVVKHYTGEPITESDLVFYDEGRLARYLEPIKNPFTAYED